MSESEQCARAKADGIRYRKDLQAKADQSNLFDQRVQKVITKLYDPERLDTFIDIFIGAFAQLPELDKQRWIERMAREIVKGMDWE